VLAWEQRPDESGKAWSAFRLFRDLGPSRTLRQAAAAYYLGTPDALPTEGQVSNIKKWSVRYDWTGRVRALEARDEMIRREGIETHMRTKAHEFGERQGRLYGRMLDQAEVAADRIDEMLGWPLSEQRMLREGPDGEDQTFVFMPSKWTLNTVRPLTDIVSAAATGRWAPTPEEIEEPEPDFSALSLDEQRQLQALLDRVGVKPPGGA
jgi:hypothetical protein